MAFKLSKTAFFLFLSLLASLVYFLPTTAHPTHNLSNFSLFAFGDMGALYDPSLVYLSFNLHHYNVLSGIDWLTSGGSSIFYARSNFGIFYPVKLFVAYFFSIDSLQKAALANAGIYYFEFAFGFFFTILTGLRFLKFSVLESICLATVFCFSSSMATSLEFGSFFALSTGFPLLLYCVLRCTQRLRFLGIVGLALIQTSYLLAGYLPLALAGFGIAILFALFYIFYLYPEDYPNKPQTLKRFFLPVFLGFFIALPDILAVVIFTTSSMIPQALTTVVYTNTLSTFSMISILSQGFVDSLSQTEGYFYLSIFLISVLFVAFLRSTPKEKFHSSSRNLAAFCWFLIIFIFLLSYTHLSKFGELFNHLVPGLGQMHLYQRYMVIGYFFFGVGWVIALRVVLNENSRILKIIAIISGTLGLITSASFLLGFQPKALWIDWNRLTEELMLTSLAFIVFSLFNKKAQYITALLLIAVLGLDTPYSLQNNYLLGPSLLTMESSSTHTQLIDFLKNHSPKTLIKYANLSPGPYPMVPRNYPWLVQPEATLSNYEGYELHLSQDKAYRSHIRFFEDYDFNWLRRTGADYLIFNQEAYSKYQSEIDQSTRDMARITLPDGTIVAKTIPSFSTYDADIKWGAPAFDNGYLVVLDEKNSSEASASKVSHFSATPKRLDFDILVKNQNALIYLPFFANPSLSIYIDGHKGTFERKDDIYQYSLSKGIHHIRIQYFYWPLGVFLVESGLFLALFGLAVIFRIFRRRTSSC